MYRPHGGRPTTLKLDTKTKNKNKKYFYPYVDEGLRYEIKDFIAAILTEGYYFNKVSKEENLMMAQVQEMYINNQNVYKL